MNLLKIENLNVFFGKTLFLKDICLNIKKGHTYHLVGENGSGKSTLLSEIAKKTNKLQVGYLPQVAHQYPKVHFLLKDISNIEYSFYPKELFNKEWHKASGGERKKALIAKTLSEGKDLIILDEPFNHLDQKTCIQIIQSIEEFVSSGKTVIFTAHEKLVESSTEIEVSKWRL